mmetsp:Transcript_11730/g.27665  ORF Transcript_11730/g.27665 Transcript_11730/m.27665 type:complete len:309 (+) Transcript_11730:1568-2494(+)
MGQEVISHKEAHEDKVINTPLEIIQQSFWHTIDELCELQLKVLAQHRQRNDLEGLLDGNAVVHVIPVAGALRSNMAGASTKGALLFRFWDHNLPNDGEVRLMGGQAQHDEIRIGTIQAVPGVRIVVRLCPLQSNELHDFVLALAWNVCIRQDDTKLELLPEWIVCRAVVNVVPDSLRHFVQEVRSRSDDVRVEDLSRCSVGKCSPFCLPVLSEPFLFSLHLLPLLCSPESTSALLVHFGTRRDTINRHVHESLRPDDPEKAIEIKEDVLVHMLLVLWCRPVFGMAAGMDDSVHVQVQIVEIAVRCILV